MKKSLLFITFLLFTSSIIAQTNSKKQANTLLDDIKIYKKFDSLQLGIGEKNNALIEGKLRFRHPEYLRKQQKEFYEQFLATQNNLHFKSNMPIMAPKGNFNTRVMVPDTTKDLMIRIYRLPLD